MDSLIAYAKVFDFVEVNSTFYSNPSIEMVRSWRRRVPEDFMFSVRCHKDLTHTYFLSPCKESHEILSRSLRICSGLKAEIDRMHDIGIIHCTDVSKEMPSSDSDILYTRLFGHGEHNLSV